MATRERTARPQTARPVDGDRRALVVLAIVGLLLIAAPLAMQMFTRAPKGATMLAEFKPYMTQAKIAQFNKDLAGIRDAVTEVDTAAAVRFTKHGLQHSGSGTLVPEYQDFDKKWPEIDRTMTDLLTKVHANVGNYNAVAALPNFKLFPWFFVLPGVILVGLALAALRRPDKRRGLRIGMAVLGIGLVAAPAIFQMFSRAPQGGRMMDAFKTIETTEKVQQIQGYFADIAGGQGAVRLRIVPQLERTGLSAAQVKQQFPAIANLDTQWTKTLADFTPMIGAMSDNVPNYQAIAALPPFPMFPWFFVVPGLLIAAVATFARPPIFHTNSGKE